MEKRWEKDKLVFIEEYSLLAEMWLETLASRDIESHGIVLQDEPFLPYNMTSIYEYQILKEEKRVLQEKDLHYVLVDVPEYWEIRADGINGAIYNDGNKMADIYFKEPVEKRYVSRIEWLKDNGNVYKIDYYNRYGNIYCTAFVDDKGLLYMKTYFTSENKDVININYSNGIVTTFHNGQISNMFGTIEEFEYYLYCEMTESNVSHMLTSVKQMRWTLQKSDIESSDISFVMWKKEDMECYRNEIYTSAKNTPVYIFSNTSFMGDDVNFECNEFRVCASTKSYPEINGSADILIYTYSDQLRGIENLIHDISEARFHIAANTQMSQVLYNLANSENVFVYPVITKQKIRELYEKCDILLDINEGKEVDNVVIEANKNSMLTLGYEDLLHNRYYVLDECVFKKDEEDSLIQKVKLLVNQKDELTSLVQKQQDKIVESTRCIMRKK